MTEVGRKQISDSIIPMYDRYHHAGERRVASIQKYSAGKETYVLTTVIAGSRWQMETFS